MVAQIDACFLRLNSSTNPHLLSEGDVRERDSAGEAMLEEARARWSRRLMHVSFGLTPLQTLISSQKEMSGN